jgi:predicted nucleotidyltransferase
MGLHQDFKDLLSAFDGAKVRYLLIGGYAVSFHSRPRYTKDIDLWISSEPENLRRVQAALATFGAPASVLEALRSLAPDEILYMGNPPVRVDILQSVSGVEFEPAFGRRIETDWEGVPVTIIGIEDLIAAKRAAGRPQDLLDAANLEKVRRREGG